MSPIPSFRLLAIAAAIGATAAPAFADVSPALLSALLNTKKETSYHMTMTGKSIGGTIEGDIALPDKMRMTMPTGASVVIGPVMYMKMNGQWKKIAGGGNWMAQMGQMNVVKKWQAFQTDYTSADLGMRTVGGVPYHAYTVTNTKTKDSQTLYIDSANRIARMESGDSVFTLSNFGQHVNIQPPI